MSNICSAHREYIEDCKLCNTTLEDLFGKEFVKQITQKAVDAGLYICNNCEFIYYKTINFCPKCYYKINKE